MEAAAAFCMVQPGSTEDQCNQHRVCFDFCLDEGMNYWGMTSNSHSDLGPEDQSLISKVL